jgi:hypothetical protein
MTDIDTERIARRHIEDLKGFYLHLLIFVLVNFALFVFDAVQDGGWWFYWTAIPWGIGVVAHGAAVYIGGSRLAAWEERRIEHYIEEAVNREMHQVETDDRSQHPYF